MFEIDTDKTIHLTRGDYIPLELRTKDKVTGADYVFNVGDVVRFTVCEKGDYGSVVLQKDVEVNEEATSVDMALTTEETKIGEIINKPKEYWYEVEVNPETSPQTIIGHDKDGAKVLMLYPEGDDASES
jgi:hypothetical protein